MRGSKRWCVVVAVMAVVAPAGAARAADGPVITNPSTTRVNHGLSFTVTGTAAPGATVDLHYHRAGTPASDYSVVRSVVASSSGAWMRTATMDVDYRVYATVRSGGPASATVLFTSSGATPPRTTSPAVTKLAYGQLATTSGTAAPGVPVVIHYFRADQPATDIQRTVMADASGKWTRVFKLDTDYSVFGSVGTLNPHTATIKYVGHFPTVGDIIDVDYAPTSGGENDVRTTLGVQFRSFNHRLTTGSASPGDRLVEASLCVRNRGPQAFDDDPADSFAVLDDDTDGVYQPKTNASGAVVSGSQPTINLTSMAVGELRCGGLVFEVPSSAVLDIFAYAPGLEENYYEGDFVIPGGRYAGVSAQSHLASPKLERSVQTQH